MPRASGLLVVGMLFAAAAPADERVAPVYALPADGTWVEFAWKLTRPGGQVRKGTLRVSCVGATEVQGVAHRWIEFRLQPSGKEAPVKLRKLLFPAGAKPLVAVAAFAGSSGGPVTRLSPGQARDFLNLGLEGDFTALKTLSGREEVVTPQGKFQACHVWAAGKRGSRRLEYHAWLVDKVGYGVIKFEVREKGAPQERRLFTASAVRSGTGAHSELDETKAR